MRRPHLSIRTCQSPFCCHPRAPNFLMCCSRRSEPPFSSLGAVQVKYIPGRSALVQYEADIDRGGVRSSETLVVSAGIEGHDQLPRLEVDGHTVSVWRYPDDPYLPGLKAATNRQRVAKLLGDLGSLQPTAQLRRRSYRPSRRAVIEAITPTTRLFIKVVRPSKVGAIQAKHEELAPHLPVPHSHGWSAELGLVVLEAMNGKTLRKTLEGGSRRLPEPEAIIGLLDSLPDSTNPQPSG